ncbi:PREDICTED: probable serine/threonine-protein kinase irlA [Trachymyrmex septentrionalis]|uniref:probable serine/threonine-protein kinase irlA n=1 Tax=Trachymyrmex septentrionalis TaxID=34720 RepID=UPI00084F78B9|nr:PREDICTED: probable serine/threonine-protein kinase irlA [Trachymyrmex septentrionalis]
MILHLYEKHDKSEIMEDPKYKSVATRFDLSRQYRYKFDVGKCLQLNCGVTIKSKFGKALQFKNHLITHHPDDNKNFFAKAVGIVSGQKILNNYEIKDTEIAECSFCQTSLPLKGLDSHTARVLAVLSRHLIPHVEYVPKILKVEMPILDEASIQTELEEEEKIDLNVNEKRQRIDQDVMMEETLRTIESVVASEDLNTLLSGQSIPNEDVPEIPGTSDSCEIRSATTQSSSIVEYRPGQRYSSGGESVSEASVSGEMQSTTTQSLLTDEPLSKQMKLDSDNEEQDNANIENSNGGDNGDDGEEEEITQEATKEEEENRYYAPLENKVQIGGDANHLTSQQEREENMQLEEVESSQNSIDDEQQQQRRQQQQ